MLDPLRIPALSTLPHRIAESVLPRSAGLRRPSGASHATIAVGTIHKHQDSPLSHGHRKRFGQNSRPERFFRRFRGVGEAGLVDVDDFADGFRTHYLLTTRPIFAHRSWAHPYAALDFLHHHTRPYSRTRSQLAKARRMNALCGRRLSALGRYEVAERYTDQTRAECL